jgi:hypothetical protein
MASIGGRSTRNVRAGRRRDAVVGERLATGDVRPRRDEPATVTFPLAVLDDQQDFADALACWISTGGSYRNGET